MKVLIVKVGTHPPGRPPGARGEGGAQWPPDSRGQEPRAPGVRAGARAPPPRGAERACPAGLDAGGRRPAGAVCGPSRGRPEGGQAPGAAAGLRGPARGAPGAAVRAAGCGRARRLPPHAAAGAARAGAQRELPGRGQASRPALPAAHQPAQRVAVGLQNFLRPCQVPQVPARGLLPVQGLPDWAVRGGGFSLPQHPSVHAHRHPPEDLRLRRGPLRVHRGVCHHPRGLHLRPRAGEGSRQCQLQHGQAGCQARPALRPHGPTGQHSPWAPRPCSAASGGKPRAQAEEPWGGLWSRLPGSYSQGTPWVSCRQKLRGCGPVDGTGPGPPKVTGALGSEVFIDAPLGPGRLPAPQGHSGCCEGYTGPSWKRSEPPQERGQVLKK